MTGYTYTVEATTKGDTTIVATGLSMIEATDAAQAHVDFDAPVGTYCEIWIEQSDQHVKTVTRSAS